MPLRSLGPLNPLVAARVGERTAPLDADAGEAYMKRWREIAVALVVGLAAGIVVLGVGGRLVMRVLAWAAGLRPEFSLGGSLEVLAAGAWRGALGGLLHVPVRRFVPERSYARGLVLGVMLFLFSIVTLPGSLRALASELGAVLLALGLFGVLFLVFGIAVEWTMRRRNVALGRLTTASLGLVMSATACARDDRLIALHAISGRPCGGFGLDGQVDLKKDLVNPPRWPGEYNVTSPPIALEMGCGPARSGLGRGGSRERRHAARG